MSKLDDLSSNLQNLHKRQKQNESIFNLGSPYLKMRDGDGISRCSKASYPSLPSKQRYLDSNKADKARTNIGRLLLTFTCVLQPPHMLTYTFKHTQMKKMCKGVCEAK